MKEWFDVYPECPYFSQKLVSEDIFGHDSLNISVQKQVRKKTYILVFTAKIVNLQKTWISS